MGTLSELYVVTSPSPKVENMMIVNGPESATPSLRTMMYRLLPFSVFGVRDKSSRGVLSFCGKLTSGWSRAMRSSYFKWPTGAFTSIGIMTPRWKPYVETRTCGFVSKKFYCLLRDARVAGAKISLVRGICGSLIRPEATASSGRVLVAGHVSHSDLFRQLDGFCPASRLRRSERYPKQRHASSATPTAFNSARPPSLRTPVRKAL